MIIKKMKLSAAVVAMAGMILTSAPVNAAPKETAKPAAEDQKKENNQEQSKYADKVVAKVKSSSTLNIRKKPNTDSKILGKMKRGALGTIVKKGTEWTKVKSGDVTGYAKNDYLVFEDDIQAFAEKNIKKVAKVTTETLRVREKASKNADVVTLVSQDETYKVKKHNSDWAKVKVDGETGYVSKDYVDVKYKFKKAKSMKQIEAERQAKLEAERKAREAQEQQTVQNSVQSSGSSSADTQSTGSNLSLKSLDGEPTCELFSHARKHGVITVADYSIGKGDEKVDRSMVSAMFRQTDYILPSYAEASLITGETEIRRIIEALQDMGAANIVLKLGGKGCYLHANGIDKMIEAYPARVVDTTGAGDCFAAGFIYGVAKGMDVEVCARLGCAAGSIAVEAVGANTALRSREQIYRRAGMQMDDR